MSNLVTDLEPGCRRACILFLAECVERDVPPLRITHTRRTLEEQAELYAKGRTLGADGKWRITAPKRVVTRAAPGESPHNYGAAFDICFLGPNPYPEDDMLWETVGLIGEQCGLVWGGRFKRFVDRPHFEVKTWRDLKAGVVA